MVNASDDPWGAKRYAVEGSPVGDVRTVPGAGNADGKPAAQ